MQVICAACFRHVSVPEDFEADRYCSPACGLFKISRNVPDFLSGSAANPDGSDRAQRTIALPGSRVLGSIHLDLSGASSTDPIRLLWLLVGSRQDLVNSQVRKPRSLFVNPWLLTIWCLSRIPGVQEADHDPRGRTNRISARLEDALLEYIVALADWTASGAARVPARSRQKASPCAGGGRIALTASMIANARSHLHERPRAAWRVTGSSPNKSARRAEHLRFGAPDDRV